MKSDKAPQDQRGKALAIRTASRPSDLKITDVRFADILGAPMRCILMKIYTNQDIVGYGEVRDWSSRSYAALLKERLLGENPCDVDRLFRRIRQFGYHGRQGGGVSGIEVALWDLTARPTVCPSTRCWAASSGKGSACTRTPTGPTRAPRKPWQGH